MFIELPTERVQIAGLNGATHGPPPLEFERLVAELSMRFINLPADQGDEAIRDALRRIGEALDLDRATLYRVKLDGVITDPVRWAADGIAPAPAPAADLFPWTFETALAGGEVCFSSLDEIHHPIDHENYRVCGTRSHITIPLSVAGQVVGTVGFDTERRERRWLPEEIQRLRVIATAFGNFLTRRDNEAALRKMLADVERLRDRLQAENVYLRRETEERLGTGVIVGQSLAIRQVLDQVRQVAATDSTVLLLGETGPAKSCSRRKSTSSAPAAAGRWCA